MKTAVIFGGTGFIGLHFTRHLLDEAGFDQVVLADIKPPEQHPAHVFVRAALDEGRVRYVHSDVRQPIDAAALSVPGQVVHVIANFAAVHREPGHAHHEYFETNLPGARHVCAYAEAVGCDDIIFTSSISPYGPSEQAKDETALPTPETAYGSSKLAAELIHEAWRVAAPARRRLLVLRPGVVFGPGEGGNVSRLVRALTKGFFVYAGNRDVRKAGIYVKELCRATWWLHEQAALQPPAVLTANLTMNPGPSMQDYVQAVQRVGGRPALVPNIPRALLMFTAHLIHATLGRAGLLRGINPVRVRKIVRANDIRPGALVRMGYAYKYDLAGALTDWRQDMPQEWQA